MLDTNVFNDVLRETIPLSAFAGKRVLVIAVQKDELRRTYNPVKQAALIAIFEEVNPSTILGSTLAFDVEGAGLDQACWNDESGNFERMLSRLRELDAGNKRKRRFTREELELNQLRDVLIAETAIKNGAILVTSDKNLRTVVSEFGGQTADRAEFLSRGLNRSTLASRAC